MRLRAHHLREAYAPRAANPSAPAAREPDQREEHLPARVQGGFRGHLRHLRDHGDGPRLHPQRHADALRRAEPVPPLPDTPRHEVCALRGGDPQIRGAAQPAGELELRPEDLRLRPGADKLRRRGVPDLPDDGVRLQALVQGTGGALLLGQLRQRHRRVVHRLRLRRDARAETALPGGQLSAPAETHRRPPGHALQRGARRDPERAVPANRRRPAPFGGGVQGEVLRGLGRDRRPPAHDAAVQPPQACDGTAGAGAPLHGRALLPRGRAHSERSGGLRLRVRTPEGEHPGPQRGALPGGPAILPGDKGAVHAGAAQARPAEAQPEDLPAARARRVAVVVRRRREQPGGAAPSSAMAGLC
mmetsp:Transcript_24256/g.76571  ORF Transcript_24256/g.76571 Transcript_24256/m.76571 type:complete len:359 (+) Transcript_24256:251-1327(+)